MRGHVTKRGKSWSVVVELPADPVTGKRRQKWHSGYRTRREAEDARVELLGRVDTGTYVPPSKQTVAGFIEEWLPGIESTVRPSTHYSYARNLRLHVRPYIGTTPLQKVDAGALNSLYASLLKDGSKHYRGGGLSPRSVYYVHTIIHRMFKDALRWERVKRNPADSATPPKVKASARKSIQTWSADELRRFLGSVEGHPLYPPFVLMATTGMRRGEALGLRWSDVNFEDAVASIKQTVVCVNHEVRFGSPKTEMGERAVDLDPATITVLKAHRQRQLEERMLMGPAWKEHDLVFCRADGLPLHPERFSRDFDKRVKASGLPRLRLHDLRHTWATLALKAGVHPKVVQERLGHASVSITLNIYSHVAPTMQKDAAAKIAGMIVG